MSGLLLTTFSLVLALAVWLKPLQQRWYMLHILLASGAAVLLEPILPHSFVPFKPPALILSVLLHLLSLNLITFVMVGWDKNRAMRGGWRIPERVMHAHALAGGTLAAWLGQRVFRHKTRKQSFQLQFRIIMAMQVTAIVVLLALLLRQQV
ncbi:MAG: DUF1294 domain-containing protein [Rickettsiales bacterium]|nr:DUF1294 domain-containing protein [Rickettsiales bacterium]